MNGYIYNHSLTRRRISQDRPSQNKRSWILLGWQNQTTNPKSVRRLIVELAKTRVRFPSPPQDAHSRMRSISRSLQRKRPSILLWADISFLSPQLIRAHLGGIGYGMAEWTIAFRYKAQLIAHRRFESSSRSKRSHK